MGIIEFISYLLQRKWILAKMLHIRVADNERISGEFFWSLYFWPKNEIAKVEGGSSENFQCSTTEIFRYNKIQVESRPKTYDSKFTLLVFWQKNMKILVTLAATIVIIVRYCHIQRISIHLLAKTNNISIIGRR